jgi:hypothetical protein
MPALFLSTLVLQYAVSLPWVIGILAALTLLIHFTYRAQVAHLPMTRRWILPTLRTAAVSAVVLSVLRPVVTRQRISSERAPVAILFDNSRSMGVVDSARSPAELVGIAGALAKLPPQAKDDQTLSIQADCDLLSSKADDVARARSELDYAKLSGRGEEAARQRLERAVAELQETARSASAKISSSMKNSSLDRTLAYLSRVPAANDKQGWLDRLRERARSVASGAEQLRFARDAELYRSDPAVREACQPVAELSRLQLAEAIVFDTHAGLIQQLGDDTAVLGFGISDQVKPIAMQHGDSAYQPLEADGAISNLTGGIAAVLSALSAAPPRAVVLFSDGRQTGADADVASLASLGVPIFTVGSASRSGIRDLSIQNVTLPNFAFVNEPVTLHADIHAPGLVGSSTQLTVTGGGATESRTLTITDEHPISVQFERRFPTAGPSQVTMEVAAVPGEMSVDNNRIERWVQVISRPTTRPVDMGRPATRPVGEAELAELSGDESMLRRLAETTGGQFFRMDQIDALARKVDAIHDDVNHPIEISLWDGPYLLALVLGCLSAEWAVRKRLGLV